MPRVTFVRKAQKAIPASGIKKGDSYYWWKFRFGAKQVSKTPPSRIELTQSSFLKQVYEIEDRITGLSWEDVEGGELDSIIEEIEALKSECEDSLANMPKHLQEGSTSGQLLQDRINTLEDWVSNLQGMDTTLNEEDTMKELAEEGKKETEIQETIEERKEAILEGIQEYNSYEGA